MSKIPMSPAPWSFGYTDDLNYPIILDAGGDVVCIMEDGVTNKDGVVMAAAPDLLEALQGEVDNAEQSAFEDWLTNECPSGDAEAVRRQWESSWEFKGFCDKWSKSRAAIAKALGEQA